MPLPGELVGGRARTSPSSTALREDLEAGYKRTNRVQRNLDALSTQVSSDTFGTLTVADITASYPKIYKLTLLSGMVVDGSVLGQATVRLPQQANICFVAMNIGGSNEAERVRTRFDLTLFEEGMITCSASSDLLTTFDLTAEWSTDGTSWTTLGPVLTFPANQDIDTPGGYQEGAFADLDQDAIDAGSVILRILPTNDGATDDIYGLHLVLRTVV